jgi:CRP/FNR family cyclic AMP-dependent transcriptional regulator
VPSLVRTNETPCQVLREDAELGEAVGAEHREQAIAECLAETVGLARGRWRAGGEPKLRDGIGLLILDGLLLRRVGIDGRFGAELLGEGDLLRPWQDSASILSHTTGWRVLETTRLALLDGLAAQRMAAYPALTGKLVGRALERSRNLAVNMAIVQQARVSTRLLMLLWHMANRWGRVGSEGVIMPLHLTHSVLGDLVAARRPTVTSALSQLTRKELVRPSGRGWLLFGDPPGELLELQDIPPARGVSPI